MFRSFRSVCVWGASAGVSFDPTGKYRCYDYRFVPVLTGEVKRLIYHSPARVNLKSICASVALRLVSRSHRPKRAVSDFLFCGHWQRSRQRISPKWSTILDTRDCCSGHARLRAPPIRKLHSLTGEGLRKTSIEGHASPASAAMFIIDDPIKDGDAFSRGRSKRPLSLGTRNPADQGLDEQEVRSDRGANERRHQQDPSATYRSREQ